MSQNNKAPRRQVIGSVVKSKEAGSQDYIKLKETGEYLQLESKAYQLQKLEESLLNGKITPEYAATKRESINKIPDFVRFEIVKYNKSE